MMPLVSVHMIVYNHQNYIEDSINGVLMQQTDFDFELVISNDCSIDASDSLIRNLINNHPKSNRIKYFNHQENLGILSNFIFTLRQCKGKYVAVCEGDDYWTDELKLKKQVDLIENDDQISMVITNREVIREDLSNYTELYEKEHNKSIFHTSDVIKGFVPGMQTVLFRNYNSICDFFYFNSEITYVDRYLAYLCSLFGKIQLIQDVTAVYRKTGEGVWSKNSSIEQLHYYTIFMDNFHHKLGIPHNNEVLARIFFNTSRITFNYCFKRPWLLSKRFYIKQILAPWVEFRKMNRISFFLSVIFHKK